MKSDWKRSEGKAGSFKHTAGKWAGDPDDKGTLTLIISFLEVFMCVKKLSDGLFSYSYMLNSSLIITKKERRKMKMVH